MKRNNEKFIDPYIGGALLGLVLLLTFYLFGRGLGASGFFDRLSVTLLHPFAPNFFEHHHYWGKYYRHGRVPLDNFLVYLSIGVFVGGFLSSFFAKTFKIRIQKGPGMSNRTRFIWAFVGGMVLAIATRFSRGCTSGQALTGGSELLIGSWVFAMAFFISGPVTGIFVKKFWR